MRRTKIIVSVAFAILTLPFLKAQTDLGVDYYYLGDYEKAEAILKKNLTENPELFNYYLGQMAFAGGDAAKAESYYNEGLRANAESALNKIGLAQLKFKTDAGAAENALNDILKKSKKNVATVVAVGRAYLNNGMTQQAMEQVNAAKAIDSKNPEIYILEGDIVASDKTNDNKGDAAGKYEMAVYFSPDYTLGYMKIAQVYEQTYPKMAIDKLKAVTEKQPDYMPACGLLGKLYTQNGFYKEAIPVFETYFKSGMYTVDDIELYARACFFTDQFGEAEKLVDEGLSKAPEHFVLNRYKMYIADKTHQTDQGVAAAGKFFSLRDTGGYIAGDYSVYASILTHGGKPDEAYAQYDQAIRLFPENMDLYTQAASTARENKDYAKAAHYVKEQMNEKATLSKASGYQDDAVDINTLGYDYYSAGVSITHNDSLAGRRMHDPALVSAITASEQDVITDSLTDVHYFAKIDARYNLNKADSVFDLLIRRAPDSYSGYRYKALTQHALHPEIEKGSAKPYYEKAIEIITQNNANITAAAKSVLLEAYNYLGYYYYMKSDQANTALYWGKVLELDPDNKNAKLVLDDIKKTPLKK